MACLVFAALLISLPLLCTSTHTTYVPPSLLAKPIAPPAGWAEQEIAKFTRVLFHDDFNTIDPLRWQHDITMTGGGNWEFEYYINNRSNTFVRNNTLFIKPTLTADRFGEANVESGFTLDLWGGDQANRCTGNFQYGCLRTSGGGNIINPIQSGLLRNVQGFNFQYGHVEIRAKLPRGDWIWPAIWMLPTYNEYGDWPASGEIDIVESRGNAPGYPAGGCDTFSSTLHWGPSYDQDPCTLTHAVYQSKQALSDDFHTYGLLWTPQGLLTYIDQPNNTVLFLPFNQSFWTRGGFNKTGMNNPWVDGSPSTPFDRNFYLIMNVAVGGTNGYFPNGVAGKPWSDTSQHASSDFWNGKGQWLPSWSGDDVAMQVDSITIFH